MGTALRTAFLHPFRMLTSLRLCHVLGRDSARGLPIQLIYLVEAIVLARHDIRGSARILADLFRA